MQRIEKNAGAVGVLLAILTLPAHLLLDPVRSLDLAALVVAVIGAIYAGFAIQSGTVRQIVVEGTVALLFGAAALAGLWWNPWTIPAAVALHGVWDLLHHGHRMEHTLISPQRWYPPFCALYDWVYAAGLSALWLLA